MQGRRPALPRARLLPQRDLQHNRRPLRPLRVQRDLLRAQAAQGHHLLRHRGLARRGRVQGGSNLRNEILHSLLDYMKLSLT